MARVRSVLRWLCALGLLAIGAGVLYFTVASCPDAVNKDVLQYWASAKLLVNHENPYDQASVYQLEAEAGAPAGHGQVMFNPPCVLSFVLPLGFLSARTAIFVWVLTIVACLMLSIRILWIMNGKRTDRLHLLPYVFAPVLACIVLGQVVPVALLGLVLFLWLHRTRPFLAGLAIPLLTVKPHLLLPFGAVVLIWAIVRRQFSFMSGVLVGLLAACSIPLSFDRQIFAQYWPIVRSANTYSHDMPNISSWIHRINPQAGYLQYALSVCAACWAIRWFLRRQRDWNWNDEGLLLIALSVAVAPYSWFEDEALLIPAILIGIYRCYDSDRSLISFGLIDGVALAMVLFNVQFVTGAYLWTSVAWLGWYCFARFNPLSAGNREDSGPRAIPARLAWRNLIS